MSPIYTHNIYHAPRLFCCSSFLFRCTRVGAYRIRPTNAPIGAGAGRWEGPFLMSPVGAQKHTPSKRPDRGGCRMMGRTFFDVLRRGVSNTPHKRPDRGECRTMGRGKIFQACGYIFGKTVFAPCGGTRWAYSFAPLPYRQKKCRVRSWISPCVPGICRY